jgi:TolB-like protein
MNFLTELKRRNVFKVGVAYLVVAWLLIQIADTLSDMLALPDVIGRTILLLLAIGLPVALIVSWIYETTPQGLVTQESVDAGTPRSTGRKLNAVIIGGLVLALAFVALDAYVFDDSATEPPTLAADANSIATPEQSNASAALEKSIAVLPFTNLSGDEEQEYFSDGLSIELINRLSQIRDLAVTGQNSSFYFKARDTSPLEIGKALGVSYLLQGSVQRAGTQLRVTAQLMEAGSSFNLWSQTFNRQVEDVFAIQDEISAAVAQALSITLGAGEFDRVGMTRNVQAYELFLQATRSGDIDTESIRELVQLLEQAVSSDPDFALAWWRLANAYNAGLVFSPQSEQTELQDKRQAALAKVESLAPDLPELLLQQAQEDSLESGGLAAVEAFLQDLVAMNIPEAELRYGNFLLRVGRTTDAMPYVQRAKLRDPLNPGPAVALTSALAEAGRLDEALQELDRLDALGGPSTNADTHRLLIAFDRGDAQLIRESNLYPQQGTLAFWYELVEELAAGNNTQVAEKIRDRPRGPNLIPAEINARATFAAFAKAPELAAGYLLETYQVAPAVARANPVVWMDLFGTARATPAFKEAMEFAGIADYWRLTGNWADKCRPLPNTETDFECF